MKKLLIATAVLLAFTAQATATQHQNNTEIQPSPGIVGPGSMFYGLETAVDDFSISAGLTSPQAVANERASEALVAAEQNNTQAAEQALSNLNKISQSHNITDENGTSKALQILGQVSKNIPEEAQQGIQTAMGNIQKNVPVKIPAGPDSTRSDGIPAEGPAMRGPSDSNDTTGSDNMPDTNGTVPTDNTTGGQTGEVPDTGDQTDTGSTTEQASASTGQFYLMVSDRPADISDFGYLNVTFEQARIFEEGDSTSEEDTNETTNSTEDNETTNSTQMNSTEMNSTETNVTENETTEEENEGFTTVDLNGTADLTQVVGDKAKSIANLNLEEGNYTKISLYAESIEASVNGTQVNVKIPPGKLMITKPFTVSANSTTGFVFDIGVFLRGNQQNNQGYILKPVISESGVAGKDVPVNLTNKKGGNIPDFAGNAGRPENMTSGGQPENTTSGQQGLPENQSTGRP